MGNNVSRDLLDRQLGRALGRKIARLERHVRELEVASQGAFRSVEAGAVDFYDDDDVLRERVGRQKDGSYGRLTLEGPVPPTPSEPDVVVIDNGVVAITWDGRCEEKWPFAEFRNVRVHMDDTADFTPTRRNQVGSIHAHRGGTIVAVTESDDDNPIWVRLVAVSTAGHTSDPSPAVLVDELDEDGIEENEELEWEDGDGHTLTAADVDPALNPTYPDVTFGLSHYPEVESLLAWWRTTPQQPTNYTVNYDAPSVTWPLSGFEKAGDRLRVQYAYMSGPPPDTVVVALPLTGVAGSTLDVSALTGSVVGSGQVWNDASDATYVSYSSGNARSPFSASPEVVPSSGYSVEVVLKTTFTPASSGLGVGLHQDGFGGLSSMGTPYIGADGWLHCPQVVTDLAALTNALNDDGATCIVGAFAAGQVYEGKVVVTWEA